MEPSVVARTLGTRSDVWAVVLDPATGGGCSTLDLLKRIPYENAAAPSPQLPPAVRAEMESIARTRLSDQERKQRSATKKGRVANMNTLGERLNRPKQVYVPGTPVDRKLKAGRLVRADGRDAQLCSSRSAPTLTTTTSSVAVDALDEAVQQQLEQQLQQHSPSLSPHASHVVAPHKEDPRITELRDQRQQLEHQLLHVTQKLCRKYSQQLFPRAAHTESPDHTRQQADKWAKSETLSEREKYALYMGSRFATQQQRDFYRREIEPREPENDRHRRETAHTKYGNALVRSKHSLRANF